jgi:hypothetical protein
MAGEALLRRQPDGSWVRIVADGLEVQVWKSLVAYAAGGLWLEGDGLACRLEPQTSLVVRGLMPFERLSTGELGLEISTGETEPPRVFVDGVETGTLSPSIEGSWAVDAMPLQTAGWHLMDLYTQSQEESRTIPFAVLPGPDVGWEEALSPIYQARCSECHDGTGRVADLSRYEAWVELGDRIRSRVQMGAMPPRPNEPLSLEEAAVIEAWLDGGMKP